MAKIILLTGATDGLGRAAAHLLHDQGCFLILHGRHKERLAALADHFGERVASFCCDLSRLSDVQTMSEEIAKAFPQIDVIINNAGVLKADHCETDEGLELRFAVNSIAPYILTKTLVKCVPDGGRIVNLSSAAQREVMIDAITQYRAHSDMAAYAMSKLAITAWTKQLSLHHHNKVFVSVNPGSLLGTKMVKEGFGIAGADIAIGADIICRAALSAEFDDANGLYYDNDAKAFGPPHEDAFDPKIGQAIIAAMEQTLNAILPNPE